jgi:hypothetical protein
MAGDPSTKPGQKRTLRWTRSAQAARCGGIEMGFPVGPLLAALADRILYNLDLIEAKAPKWETPEQDQPPYSDTQLLISLLGVLIFPHEQAPGALGELMRGYKSLRNVLNVVYSQRDEAGVEIADADGDAVIIDPARLVDLPRLLRNSVAHFNILPINKGGRFSGIRIWNRRDSDKQITFVADMDFDEMRSLARYVLGELRKARADLPLQDPEDPMIEVESQREKSGSLPVKVPRLNPDIWSHLVDAHDGNAGAARTTLDRLVKREADRIRKAERSR